jgi:hypothetical protein
MIPITVSDMLKILEQIPGWKAVAGLPKRVAELERRVQELETQKPHVPPGRECPICGAVMDVIDELPHPHFGSMGVKVHSMRCPHCEHKTSRDFEPGKGYG